MNLFNLFKSSKYKSVNDAVIISCYFNPTHSLYRKKVFEQYYKTIKHLNHRIIECVHNGDNSELRNLVPDANLEIVYSGSILWHKETLLNRLIFKLSAKYNYVFWIDADVIFSNKNWLVEGCKELENSPIVQPFEFCVHLDKDQTEPDNNLKCVLDAKFAQIEPKQASKYKIWRSFCANVKTDSQKSVNTDYDIHGHVGFAWGGRLDYLKAIGGLYDRALVGGADHIMAHAFAGQIPCECITKSFGDQEDILQWSNRALLFNQTARVGYVQGDLYHLWHGDIEKRQYLKRIKEFQPEADKIRDRDENGLFTTNDDSYVRDYFIFREVTDMLIDTVNPENLFQESRIDPGEFDGGQFGGSGAGADWIDEPTENFS